MIGAWAIVLCALLNASVNCENSELLSVTVLYRHGCRAPRIMYKGDPYIAKITEIWPEGLSQLTRLGKLQQYALGQWYREHYKNFIPEQYNPSFLKVVSSNKDRCLMSAAVNLAGLFPPKKGQLWNSDILWQPIPIHTTPENKDAVISNEIPCKKYDRLQAQLSNSEYYSRYMEENKELFDYISKHAGESITTPQTVTTFHDTLFVENYFNQTLPDWTLKVFPHRTLPLLTKVYVLETNNTALARLKSGPLIDFITSFFENVIKHPANSQKLLMLSVHDSTIGHLLNTLNVYDNSWPEYASTIMFELRQRQDKLFLNIYFKNSTMLRNIQLEGCQFDCPFEEFTKIIEPVRLSADDFEKECSSV